MDAAELRKARYEILAVHVDAENRNDVDAVIATFRHARYELVPVGEIFDGEAEVRRYYREKEARGRTVYEQGDLEAGIWYASMAQGLVQDIPPVAELVERIVAEAEAIITGRLRATVTDDRVPTGA